MMYDGLMTDELHIQDLLQAICSLSSLSEGLNAHFLKGVVEKWKHLYVLLMESLCSKHGLDKKDLTGNRTPTESAESCEVHVYTGHPLLFCYQWKVHVHVYS